jgi:ABC-type amino acid transport substrate-binding protein
MKSLLLFFTFTVLLWGESFTFVTGKNNVAQKVSSIIVEKAYKRAGFNTKIQFLPLQEALNLSKSGRVDGEVARIENITKYAPDLRIVPITIMSVEAIAFSKKDIVIGSWNDLKDYNLTIVKGAKFIEIACKNLDKNLVTTFKEAAENLYHDKTDVIVIPKLAMYNLRYQYGYKEIKRVSHVLKKMKLYHFVHKKNKHLVPIITPILEKMRDSGELYYLRKSYLRSITPKKRKKVNRTF